MNTRAINMQRRRDRILTAAREMITSQGFEALNVRSLAEAADVTVPTLYNLIGNKNEILMTLMVDAIERIEQRLKTFETEAPLEMAEAIAIESTELFQEDESFYRAAMIASDRADARKDSGISSSVISDRSVRMAVNACRAARRQGLLLGKIPPEILGEQMFVCYRVPMRDWAYGEIEISEFCRRVLQGFYICLASDASEEFQNLLRKKIRSLNKERKAMAV